MRVTLRRHKQGPQRRLVGSAGLKHSTQDYDGSNRRVATAWVVRVSSRREINRCMAAGSDWREVSQEVKSGYHVNKCS